MAKLTRGGSDWNSMDLASIGITLVLAIGIGSGLGWWIGGKLGNQTTGLIIGFIVGTAAGFIEMFRAVSRWNRRMERQEQVENSSDKIGVHENRACPDPIGDRNGADRAAVKDSEEDS